MAFSCTFEYDIFVSYAHVDNLPMSTEESRWVSVLIKHLTVRLSQKLGRADLCAIWIDNKDLKGNHELRGQIPDEVRRSALFLPILSPGYVASSWCGDELITFTEANAAALKKRIFAIYREPLHQPEKTPAALQDLRKYQFWNYDENKRSHTYATPEATRDDREYWRLIDEVAYDIVELLRELKNQPPQTDSPAPASTSTAGVKPHVLLAAEGNIEAARLVAIDAMDDVKRPAAGELSSAVGATVALQEPARTLVGTYGWPTQGRRSEGEGWRLPIEFDPNGRFVAVAGPSREPGVHLWDTKTGSAIRAFAGLHAQIRSLALSPDGTIVVAGSSDGEAVAWQNTDAAPVIGRVQLSTGAITALTFSPDGQAVLIGSEDSDVPSVWRLPTAWQDAMAEPCQSSAVPAHKYAGKGPKRGQ